VTEPNAYRTDQSATNSSQVYDDALKT